MKGQYTLISPDNRQMTTMNVLLDFTNSNMWSMTACIEALLVRIEPLISLKKYNTDIIIATAKNLIIKYSVVSTLYLVIPIQF